MSKKGLHSITLFEIVVVLVVCVGFGVFLIRPMQIARQSAVVKPMTDLGARTATNTDRSVHRLDATRMPADEIRMDQIISLGDLRYLNLDHSEIADADLAPIAEHLDIRELHVVATAVTDAAVEHIAKMKNLHLLDARATFFTDAGVAGLTGLKQMQILRLGQSWISDAALESIARFPRLHLLDLRYSNITNGGLAAIAAMKRLEEVRLTGAHVSETAVERLRSQRPDLKVEFVANDGYSFSSRVILRQKNYRNPGTADLDRKFRLSERKIGRELEEIGASVRLHNGFITGVVCHRPKFNDEHLKQLMWCRCLSYLELHDASVTAAGWSMIHRNRFLARLNLKEVTIDSRTLKYLSGLWHLKQFATDGMTDDAFKTMNTRAVWLAFTGSPLTDESVRMMTRDRFIRLTHLMCDHTQITDAAADLIEQRLSGLQINTPRESRESERRRKLDSERRRQAIRARREQQARDRKELERMGARSRI